MVTHHAASIITAIGATYTPSRLTSTNFKLMLLHQNKNDVGPKRRKSPELGHALSAQTGSAGCLARVTQAVDRARSALRLQRRYSLAQGLRAPSRAPRPAPVEVRYGEDG